MFLSMNDNLDTVTVSFLFYGHYGLHLCGQATKIEEVHSTHKLHTLHIYIQVHPLR
jgi:hypothetical protein